MKVVGQIIIQRLHIPDYVDRMRVFGSENISSVTSDEPQTLYKEVERIVEKALDKQKMAQENELQTQPILQPTWDIAN